MRKFLFFLIISVLILPAAIAAKMPDDVSSFILKSVPGTDIRFDGVIIMPDNTIYLPLYPSLFADVNKLKVKKTIPENLNLSQRPDVLIFNNDFVLLKVLSDNNGHRSVLHMVTPPLEVRTGLLPQDMLVPSGLVLPENLKGIIGNLKIDTKNEDVIKKNTKESFEEFLSETDNIEYQNLIPQLKNKSIFITTNYSKNIQVITPPKSLPDYSLAQKSIPIDIETVNHGKFLLVTSYERPFLDVVSVADSRFIKQINLGAFPDEIVTDEANNRAYVTAPKASTIFVIDLKTMSILQKIRVNGYCEKFLLADNKMFYVDKLKGDIWSIEPENSYTLKNIGKFPNISALAFSNNKLYAASRTKSRIAVVDYDTLSLEREFTTVNKPISMLKYGNVLYVLGAQNNRLQRINMETGTEIDTTDISTGGFSSKINQIENSNYAVIADIRKNIYTIIDLKSGKILKSYTVNVPIKDIKITDKVKLFD